MFYGFVFDKWFYNLSWIDARQQKIIEVYFKIF